jgi:hypothetical protein
MNINRENSPLKYVLKLIFSMLLPEDLHETAAGLGLGPAIWTSSGTNDMGKPPTTLEILANVWKHFWNMLEPLCK